MSTKDPFAFGPEQLTEMLNSFDFSKFLDTRNLDDPAILELQKRNMESLVAASEVASEQYMALFASQLAAFRKNLASVLEDGGTTEAVKSAVEEAAKQIQELGEQAKVANEGAFEQVAEAIRTATEEMQNLAGRKDG
jgi:hypothetical protein